MKIVVVQDDIDIDQVNDQKNISTVETENDLVLMQDSPNIPSDNKNNDRQGKI